MGKKHGAAAQRAKKKHEREVKRRRAQSKRRLSTTARVGQAKWRLPGPRLLDWLPAVDGIEGLAAGERMHPYEAARIVEHLSWFELGGTKLPDVVWTPSKVAALATAELLAHLERFGIRADARAFVMATPRFGSAWRYARETWFPAMLATASVHDRDFAGLAACELWRRWRADTPSQEMLLDPLLLGQAHADHHDYAAATARWIEFWALLRPMLSPEARTTAAADALLEGGGPLLSWASDLATAALYTSERDTALARRAAQVLAEVLAQFCDEDEAWKLAILEDRERCLDSSATAISEEPGETPPQEASASRAAATVRSMSASVWAPLRNAASYCDGGQ
jgi:hypothetical protein